MVANTSNIETTNKGPVLELIRERVMLNTISVSDKSGWRPRDDGRSLEIKQLCHGGQMGMNVFGGVTLLKGTADADGCTLIDDGLSTVLAWKEMEEEYGHNASETPLAGQPWDPKVLEVFSKGLVITWASYDSEAGGNENQMLREAWNAAKHDEENNKYRNTPLHVKLHIVQKRFERMKDYSLVTQDLLSIYGKAKYSTIQRWVSL